MKKVVVEGYAAELPQCNTANRLMGTVPHTLISNKKVISRIENLNSVEQYVDFNEGTVTILILTQDEQHLSFNEEERIVRIGVEKLSEPGALEKAILFLKVQNQNPLAASAIAHFIWEELREDRSNIQTRSWVTYLNTLGAYCESQNILQLHESFCRAHNELNDSYISPDEDEPVPWSLRPVYTQILKEVYRELNLRDKQKLLTLISFLGEIEDTFIEDRSVTNDVVQYNESFKRMVRDWLMPLSVDQSVVERAIAKYTLGSAKTAQYVYVGRGSQNDFSLSFSEHISSQQDNPLIIQLGQEQYFYPSDVPQKMKRQDLFKFFKIPFVIYVSCYMPEVESLLEFQNQTNRVLYVKQCQEEDINWGDVAKFGLSQFLNQNTKIEFVEFNLSALKLAKKIRGPLVRSEDFSQWQKWLIWQRIEKAEGVEVSRPLSVIDGVSRFCVF